MTQAEKDKIVKELQEKLAEVEKIKVDDSKRWKPEAQGKIYWLVESGGEVTYQYWDNDNRDNWCYLTGNCFKTRKEAEEYKKKIEYTARYKNYIKEHNNPLDSLKGCSPKYYAYMRIETQEVAVDNCDRYKYQGVIYASSREIIEDAIKEIGEDNFKKYVLGVK